MKTFFTLLTTLVVVATIAQKKPKINQAKSSLESGDYSTAKSIVDQAAVHEKTKEDPITWFVRGQVYVALDTANNEVGALEEAIKAFEKALELDPEQKKTSSVDYSTGTITTVDSKKQEYYAYYYNQAVKAYSAEDYENAATNFEAAFYIVPIDTNAIINAAYAAGLAGNNERAAANYLKAYEAGSTEMNIFLQLYNYHVQNESYEKALDVLQKGKKIYPDDVDLMKYEVNLYIQMEKIDEAQKGMEEAIAIDSNNADLYFTLGVLKDESGDKPGAKEAYLKAIEVDENHYNSNFNLGVIFTTKINNLVKEQGELNYYPGQSRPNQEEKKKYDDLEVKIDDALKEALPVWERCYAINNSDVNVLQTLAYLYNSLKKKEQYEKISAEIEAVKGN